MFQHCGFFVTSYLKKVLAFQPFLWKKAHQDLFNKLAISLIPSMKSSQSVIISQYDYDILVITWVQAKPRTNINNKDIIQMYLEYNLFISQRAILINASFVTGIVSNGFTYQLEASFGSVHLSKPSLYTKYSHVSALHFTYLIIMKSRPIELLYSIIIGTYVD